MQPARVQRLLHTLAEEFAQHTTTFHQAAADGNLDALRALRHKLHSALTQPCSAPVGNWSDCRRRLERSIAK